MQKKYLSSIKGFILDMEMPHQGGLLSIKDIS